MIQQSLSGMLTLMLAKFMMNDVPHFLFEETTMRELKVTRVDEKKATSAQLRLIAIKSARLKIPEPVVKEFGEAGRMIRELEAEEKHRKQLRSGNPGPDGTCYRDAWRFIIKEEEGTLVHGTVSTLGKRVNHAWIETETGYIWEPQTGGFFTYNAWQAAAEPIEEHRYTAEQTAIMVARTFNHGPWTDEERAKWIR